MSAEAQGRTVIRPYGDTTGDGRIQVSFTLPLPSGTEEERLSGDRKQESLTIDLTRLQSLTEPETELLNRYLMMIQLQRQDFNGRVLTIRRDDLRAIACLFETSADHMRRRLDELGVRL